MPWSISYKTVLLSLLGILAAQEAISAIMRFFRSPVLFASLSSLHATLALNSYGSNSTCSGNASVDLSWHAPAQTNVNSLSSAINGTGTYGFIFNSSQGPLNTYNWCNMPHVNKETYPRANSSYKLQYVEVIHRHHKRTPYAANTFPREQYAWYCSDEGLFYGGKPINPAGNLTADTYWNVYTSPSNPLAPTGFNGTCQFPQITRGGLDDSHQHGVDLKAVYHDLLHFLPSSYDAKAVSYRVTNNVITSQVASMLTVGMWPTLSKKDTPLLIQPASIDSLEPAYTCSAGSALFSSYGVGSTKAAWLAHLTASAPLFSRLDALSGISPSSTDWHKSYDHYFDNLSARLCHDKALPCNINNTADCVSQAEANEVFRLGEYEYSFIYRDSPQSLLASTASYGIWIAELAQNLRHAAGLGPPAVTGSDSVKYRHNVAHDGSISRLLSILQLEQMVWPGMGSEVVFELYTKEKCYFVRVLWGGQILKSSHPAFGLMDMVPLGTLLGYFNGLVGTGAMTRTHKVTDRDHVGLANGTAAAEEHLPRYFGKAGRSGDDPAGTKKQGNGKGNWGKDGMSELEDYDYNPAKPRRRTNSMSSAAGHNLFKSKYEASDPEAIIEFDSELHGAADEEHNELEKMSTSSSADTTGSVEEEEAVAGAKH
nr:hypothetical protein B0A51_08423 [Rachicladosporium sp. CCFEE 5018]